MEGLDEYAEACEEAATWDMYLAEMYPEWAEQHIAEAAMFLTAANLARGVYRG